jgi:hypothetical protein
LLSDPLIQGIHFLKENLSYYHVWPAPFFKRNLIYFHGWPTHTFQT